MGRARSRPRKDDALQLCLKTLQAEQATVALTLAQLEELAGAPWTVGLLASQFWNIGPSGHRP